MYKDGSKGKIGVLGYALFNGTIPKEHQWISVPAFSKCRHANRKWLEFVRHIVHAYLTKEL